MGYTKNQKTFDEAGKEISKHQMDLRSQIEDLEEQVDEHAKDGDIESAESIAHEIVEQKILLREQQTMKTSVAVGKSNFRKAKIDRKVKRAFKRVNDVMDKLDEPEDNDELVKFQEKMGERRKREQGYKKEVTRSKENCKEVDEIIKKAMAMNTLEIKDSFNSDPTSEPQFAPQETEKTIDSFNKSRLQQHQFPQDSPN